MEHLWEEELWVHLIAEQDVQSVELADSMKERKDVEGAKDTVENLNQQLTTLDSEFKNEVLNLDAKLSQKDLETVTIKPGKANISVKLVSLVWMPN